MRCIGRCRTYANVHVAHMIGHTATSAEGAHAVGTGMGGRAHRRAHWHNVCSCCQCPRSAHSMTRTDRDDISWMSDEPHRFRAWLADAFCAILHMHSINRIYIQGHTVIVEYLRAELAFAIVVHTTSMMHDMNGVIRCDIGTCGAYTMMHM